MFVDFNNPQQMMIVDPNDNSRVASVDASGNLSVFVKNDSGNPIPVSIASVGILQTQDQADGPVDPGTAASKSILLGGRYRSTLAALTDGQQAAIAVDASARVLVSQPVVDNFLVTSRTQDGAGNAISSTSNALHVAVTQPLPAGTNNVGRVSVQDSSGNPFSNSNPLPVRDLGYVGNAFALVLDTVNAQSAEGGLLLVTNPNGSGKTLYFVQIFANTDPANSTWSKFRVFYAPTITGNGTSRTPVNLTAGSATASVANVFSGPTYSARGSQIYVTETSAGTPQELRNVWTLPPNQSMLITSQAKSNNVPIELGLFWYEA